MSSWVPGGGVRGEKGAKNRASRSDAVPLYDLLEVRHGVLLAPDWMWETTRAWRCCSFPEDMPGGLDDEKVGTP